MIGRVLNVLAILALLLVAAGWFVFLRPASMGGSATWIIVRGDSMLPAYQTGDLIVFTAAPSYAVGDVVAYRVPAGEVGAGQIVMHRIVGGDASGLVLQGDNNPAPDPWRPATADVVGSVWLVGSQLGRPIVLLHQPALAAALAAAVVVAVMLSRRPSRPGARRSFGRTKVPVRTGPQSGVEPDTQPV